MFNIEMLPAGHGDGLLLVYGDPAKPHYVLIDGGPYYVFSNKRDKQRVTLKKRIQQLLKTSNRIELFVITHIDADHIEAPIRLLNNMPHKLEIGEIWFNDLRHLQGGFLGPEQGEMLSALIDKKLHLPWNTSFSERAVAWDPTSSPPTKCLDDGLQFTVLSPTPQKMTALVPEWEKAWSQAVEKAGSEPRNVEERRRLALQMLQESRLGPKELDGWLGDPVKEYGDEPFDENTFEEDSTHPNGSSIALLVEYEGKTCLFAGDAHPSVLTKAIQQILQQRGKSDALEVNAFKLPHHGSKNNLSPELIKLVKTDNYLLSSNGSYYDHPHPQTIARLIKANLDGWDKITFWFNYRSGQTEIWDDDDLCRRYRYRARYPAQKNRPMIVAL